MKSHSEHFIRQRKLYTALPVLIAPFLILLFWALGGGQGSYANVTKEAKGLNTQVPNPQLTENENAWDKFSLYQQAQRDSLKKAEAERTDPYFRLRTMTGEDSIGLINHSLGKKGYDIDSNEVAINKKITEINAIISQPKTPTKRQNIKVNHEPVITAQDESIDQLEEMMMMMQSGDQGDPEMAQIENVLEKILDVQHPERVRDKIQQQSTNNSGKVFSVSSKNTQLNGSFFGTKTLHDTLEQRGSKFYGLNESNDENSNNLISAVVNANQILTNNSIVKLRLADDIYINGKLIPSQAFLFGVCNIQNERIVVTISTVFSGNTLYPVHLTAFDTDGLEGLYIPGTMANEASRQGTSQVLQDLQLMSLDPSIGAQAASAGIQTAKTLIGKKAKAIKVQVKAGYNVLLMDKSNHK
jgi:conjugative transposon TraM protein